MKISLRSRKSRAVFVLWFVEVLLVVLAVMLAIRLRFHAADPAIYAFFANTSSIPMRALVVALFTTGAMAAFGLYQVHTRHNRIDFVLRLGLSFAFGAVALLVLYYLVPQTYIGRSVLAMAMAISLVLVAGLRLLSQQMFDHELFRRRVLVLGAGRNADLINSSLRRRSDRHSFVVVGYVPVAGQAILVPEHLLVRTDCGMPELTRLLNVHEIVVAPDERRGGLPMEEMLSCAQRGVNVTDLSSFFEREAGHGEAQRGRSVVAGVFRRLRPLDAAPPEQALLRPGGGVGAAAGGMAGDAGRGAVRVARIGLTGLLPSGACRRERARVSN